MLALLLDELFRAHEASLLSDDICDASRRLSGPPITPADNENVAADIVVRGASDTALVAAALKNCNRYGDQDLQDYLLQLLIKMTLKHHPTLLNNVIPGTFNCGRPTVAP